MLDVFTSIGKMMFDVFLKLDSLVVPGVNISLLRVFLFFILLNLLIDFFFSWGGSSNVEKNNTNI